MNRRRILSMLIALAAIVTALAAGPATASAQPITWCPVGCYTVDLSNVPASCFPLCINTSWGGGVVFWPPAANPCYPAPAIYTECPIPVLPVGSPLDKVLVCGTVIPGGVVGQTTVICPNGCNLCVALCTTAAGCLVIKVYPGPCPIVPLPCP